MNPFEAMTAVYCTTTLLVIDYSTMFHWFTKLLVERNNKVVNISGCIFYCCFLQVYIQNCICWLQLDKPSLGMYIYEFIAYYFAGAFAKWFVYYDEKRFWRHWGLIVIIGSRKKLLGALMDRYWSNWCGVIMELKAMDKATLTGLKKLKRSAWNAQFCEEQR